MLKEDREIEQVKTVLLLYRVGVKHKQLIANKTNVLPE
jgi:hypothetical protein